MGLRLFNRLCDTHMAYVHQSAESVALVLLLQLQVVCLNLALSTSLIQAGSSPTFCHHVTCYTACAELLAHPLPKVRITSQQASADMRLPSGRYFKLELYKNNEAYQYVNHLITGYTAESGSTSTEPKITLHLKSPAAQQAEAAALRAEEKETGWITYAYHQVLTTRLFSLIAQQQGLMLMSSRRRDPS